MKPFAVACLFAVFAFPAAAQDHVQPLWPNGAPGPKAPAGAETVRVTDQGDHVVSNVTTPVIIPYLPAHPNGAAVVIIPGGGHVELWMDHEGYNVAQWLSDHGVTAIIVKYRLSKATGSPYNLDDSLGDVQRAIRVVRSRAGTWHIDPARVGVIGFSAGGQLAELAGWSDATPNLNAADPVDAQSSRPDFTGIVYPVAADHKPFSAATPPAFLLAGDQDDIAKDLPALAAEMKADGASAELHWLAGVGHGFGIRATNPPQVAIWPQLFYNWMEARGFLTPAGPAPKP